MVHFDGIVCKTYLIVRMSLDLLGYCFVWWDDVGWKVRWAWKIKSYPYCSDIWCSCRYTVLASYVVRDTTSWTSYPTTRARKCVTLLRNLELMSFRIFYILYDLYSRKSDGLCLRIYRKGLLKIMANLLKSGQGVYLWIRVRLLNLQHIFASQRFISPVCGGHDQMLEVLLADRLKNAVLSFNCFW